MRGGAAADRRAAAGVRETAGVVDPGHERRLNGGACGGRNETRKFVATIERKIRIRITRRRRRTRLRVARSTAGGEIRIRRRDDPAHDHVVH